MTVKLSLSFNNDDRLCVDVPSESAEVIQRQFDRLPTDSAKEVFADAMLKHLGRVLATFLEPDLRPPTEKQIAYAMGLSRRLKVSIPRDALIYKEAMEDFLAKYGGNSSSRGFGKA